MNAPAPFVWVIARVPLATCLLAATVACAPAEGGEGEPCKCDNCGIFSGHFYCDPGLICNTGILTAGYKCERPMSVPQGGTCVGFSSDLCVAGLACTFTSSAGAPWTCEPGHSPLQLGDPCPSGTGCGASLVCLKGAGGAVCSTAHAGDDAAPDGDAGGDGG